MPVLWRSHEQSNAHSPSLALMCNSKDRIQTKYVEEKRNDGTNVRRFLIAALQGQVVDKWKKVQGTPADDFQRLSRDTAEAVSATHGCETKDAQLITAPTGCLRCQRDRAFLHAATATSSTRLDDMAQLHHKGAYLIFDMRRICKDYTVLINPVGKNQGSTTTQALKYHYASCQICTYNIVCQGMATRSIPMVAAGH